MRDVKEATTGFLKKFSVRFYLSQIDDKCPEARSQMFPKQTGFSNWWHLSDNGKGRN